MGLKNDNQLSCNYAVAFLYTCRKKPALLSTSRPEQMGETRGVISLCSTTEMGELKIDPQAAAAASLELSYPAIAECWG